MSIRLNGSADSLIAALASALSFGTADFSIGFGVRIKADRTTVECDLLHVADATTPATFIDAFCDFSGNVLFGGNNTGSVGGGFSLTTDSWFWVTLTRASGVVTVRYYADTSSDTAVSSGTFADVVNYTTLDTLIFGAAQSALRWPDAEFQLLKIKIGVAWTETQGSVERRFYQMQTGGGTNRIYGLQSLADGLVELNGADNAFTNTGAIDGASRPSQLEADPVGYTLTQNHIRWRDDNGSETTATFLGAEDAAINRALGINTRCRFQILADGDPGSLQFETGYQHNGGSWRTVEVPDGAAVAWGANGTVTTTGTTAPTVAYPAGITKGQQLLMLVVNRPNANTVSTPSGWTAPASNSVTGGAGTEGAGTGSVRLTLFTKIATGTETGSETLAITGGTSVCAVIIRLTRGLGKDFVVEFTTGSDSSAGTGVSITFGSTLALVTTDLVLVAFGSSEDTATFASETLSATGITTGSLNERIEQAVTTGNDCKLLVCEFPITAGPASAAATFAATASGTNAANVAGPAMMIRISQIDQPVIMSPSSNITASGENTTGQLTAVGGGAVFVAGRMYDDENPADGVDLTDDDFTEMEPCVKFQSPAVNTDTIKLRQQKSGGTALDTYSHEAQVTIGSGAGSPVPKILQQLAA